MTNDVDDLAIADRLLAVLRDRAGRPALEYAVGPVRIPGGFDTRIFAFALRDAPAPLAGPLVLRLHRPETDPAKARFEAVVHRTVAGLGYPCPPALLVGDARDGLGGAFLVMPRVAGRVLLATLRGPGLVRVPGMLARWHLALHALDAGPLRRALAAADCDPARCGVSADLAALGRAVEHARLDGLRAALAWLIEHCPPEPAVPVVCHGDFHPLNILMEGARVTGVVDWANLRFADPAYDVGATVALLRNGPLDVPRGVRALVALGRRWLVDAYRRSYLRGRPLEPGRLRYYEALRTLGFLVEGRTHRQAAAGVIDPPTKPSAFVSPRVLDGAARRLHALTGVRPGSC